MFIFIYACNNTLSDVQQITIDPYIFQEPVAASKIFDSIKFIQLETKKVSHIENIDQLEVTKNYFFIFDRISNAIFLFSKDGLFARKIFNPDIKIGAFAIDRLNKKVIIKDVNNMKLVFFDFMGNKIKEQSYPLSFFISMAFAGQCQYYTPGYRSYDENQSASFSLFNMLVIDSSCHVINRFFPFTTVTKNDIFDSEQYFYFNDTNSLFFSYPYDYKVAQLKDGKIIKEYKFVFPQAYRLPVNFINDINYDQGRWEHFRTTKSDWQKMVWNCTDFYQLENGIFSFNLQSSIPLNNTILYNPKNNYYIRLQNIGTDKKINYLPFFENRILAAAGNSLYSSVSPAYLLQNISAIGVATRFKENERIKSILKIDAESNPFITELIIKELYFKN